MAKPKRPKYVFRPSACSSCRRYEPLVRGGVGVDASKLHTEKMIQELRNGQRELIRDGAIEARDVFVDAGVKEIPLDQLLPHQNGLSHPDKFCYVANRRILEEPILIAQIAGLRPGPELSAISGVRHLYVIIDGHTRAAIKSGMAKDLSKAKIKAKILMFPTAESFYRSYFLFQRKYPDINAHLKSVMEGTKEFIAAKANMEAHLGTKAVPCPGVMPRIQRKKSKKKSKKR